MIVHRFHPVAALAFVVFSSTVGESRPPPQHHHKFETAQHWRMHPPSATGAVDVAQRRRLQTSQVQQQEEQRLRSDLLQNYDLGSYPWGFAWAQNGWTNETNNNATRQGLGVEVGINFHRIFSVDIISSVADLIVWFRQRWVDPRLSWNPEDYGGIDKTWFWIGDGVGSAGETSEIWTPDLELWNMESSLKQTLTDSYAYVDSTGTVYWSRPGHIRAACKFGGLDSFPFDRLVCTMELGSWSYSGLYLRPQKMDGVGFTVGGSETAGESFTEYQLSDNGEAVIVREKVYPPFPGSPEEDWPVLLYDVRFHRSWQPYARGYIVLQILLNLAGFATFFLPVQCGERISLVITAMLAAVASELVVAANLPASSEMTWFQRFSLVSLAFAALALFESAAAIFFFYYTGDDLVPAWWIWIRDQRRKRSNTIRGNESGRAKANGQNDSNHAHEDSCDESGTENGVALDVDCAVSVKGESRKSGTIQEDTTSHPFIDQTRAKSSSNNEQAVRRSSFVNMTRDAEDFIDDFEAANNKRWRKVSLRIDEVCRVIVPVIYAITLGIMLGQVKRL